MNPERGTEPRSALRVGEVARLAEVSTDTIRYYERLGLLESPRRTAAGYRSFDPHVLERLGFIRKARALGLTLAEVGEILRASLADSPPCEHVRLTLTTRLGEVERRIEELETLRGTLRQALRRAQTLPVATSCVCGIIESQPLPKEKP